MSDRYRITLVCLGNICRSPMAHVVLEDKLTQAGLTDRVEVTSSGTGDWHIGEPMDRRAAARLRDAGYDPTRHRARQVSRTDLAEHDLVLAMDSTNLAALQRLAPEGTQVRLFRDFDPQAEPGAEVPDPWFGGPEGFDEVLDLVERTAESLVEHLRAELNAN